MWALRRASSNAVKAQGLNVAAFRASAGLGPLGSRIEDKPRVTEQLHCTARDMWIAPETCNCKVPAPNRFSFMRRCLSSQAGAKSGGEEVDALEDGFSELEGPEGSETNKEVALDSSSSSESDSDLSGVDENLEEPVELLGDTEDVGQSVSKNTLPSGLVSLILKEPSMSIAAALDKFAKEQEISDADVHQLLGFLRRRKFFGKALQVSEWFERQDGAEFSVRDYVTRIDLIAKVRGIKKAESYIYKIPESFRVEAVYRTLLANCINNNYNNNALIDVAKCEEIFNKMRGLEFSLSAFTCNQMLLLYKKTDKKKIADVLVMMEQEDIEPNPFTYQLLIDIKGQSNDVDGMEQVVATMESEGVEPNSFMKAILARHYAGARLEEKAVTILKEIEQDKSTSDHFLCKCVLPIYADLGKAEEVERIWKLVESNPRESNFVSAIGAFGKLKNVEMAEAVFDKMLKSGKKLSAGLYTSMLKVYANNRLLSKGKELLKKMVDSGCDVGPMAWDALVKLYVDAGEVEKADSILQKAVKQNSQMRPLFSSYMTLLEQYSKRGDVHNAEKIFQRMRQVGYVARPRSFQVLLQAYINAKAPAYGIRERLKADNIFPNKGLASQLALVDIFRKSAASDLLD